MGTMERTHELKETAMQTMGRNGRLLRIDQVLERIPVSKTTWYEGVRKGVYPPPVRLTPRTTAWFEADIDDLMDRFRQSMTEYPQ